MKCFVILLILIAFGFVYHAYAELDKSILEPFENSDLVIIGTIIQVNTIQSENKIQYNVIVEECLNGKKSFNMITVVLDEICSVDKTYTLCVTNPDLIYGEKEDKDY